MGRRSLQSGVRAIGHRRIQFDFKFEGVRYRPNLLRFPSESNLRGACEQLRVIKTKIAEGTFHSSMSFLTSVISSRFRVWSARTPVRGCLMNLSRIANPGARKKIYPPWRSPPTEES